MTMNKRNMVVKINENICVHSVPLLSVWERAFRYMEGRGNHYWPQKGSKTIYKIKCTFT